jgi:hypothetical protein
VNTDSTVREQVRDRRAGGRTEELQRRLLVRDDDDLEVRETSCRLERELVQRQRPADRTGQCKTTRFVSFSASSPSSERNASLSAGPRKVKAPGTDSTGRAPTAISKTS